MSKYRSRSEHAHQIISESGTKIVPKYRLEYLDNGAQTLVQDGVTDIYEPIQLGAEEAKISNIVARVSYGDTSALEQRVGQYFDATTMPESLQEAMELTAKVPELMERLKTELKEAKDETTKPEEGSDNNGAAE